MTLTGQNELSIGMNVTVTTLPTGECSAINSEGEEQPVQMLTSAIHGAVSQHDRCDAEGSGIIFPQQTNELKKEQICTSAALLALQQAYSAETDSEDVPMVAVQQSSPPEAEEEKEPPTVMVTSSSNRTVDRSDRGEDASTDEEIAGYIQSIIRVVAEPQPDPAPQLHQLDQAATSIATVDSDLEAEASSESEEQADESMRDVRCPMNDSEVEAQQAASLPLTQPQIILLPPNVSVACKEMVTAVEYVEMSHQSAPSVQQLPRPISAKASEIDASKSHQEVRRTCEDDAKHFFADVRRLVGNDTTYKLMPLPVFSQRIIRLSARREVLAEDKLSHLVKQMRALVVNEEQQAAKATLMPTTLKPQNPAPTDEDALLLLEFSGVSSINTHAASSVMTEFRNPYPAPAIPSAALVEPSESDTLLLLGLAGTATSLTKPGSTAAQIQPVVASSSAIPTVAAAANFEEDEEDDELSELELGVAKFMGLA
jgi:hypothetical protein